MPFIFMFYRLACFGALVSLLSLNLPAKAETCVPINVVGGQGNTVTKTVAQPTISGPFGIKITRNNWNTDWAVPGGVVFSRFVVTLTSDDRGPFDIRVALNYSDQTSDEFFNQNGFRFEPGKPLVVEAQPRPGDQPYHVNVFVNGIQALGRTYTASVVACR